MADETTQTNWEFIRFGTKTTPVVRLSEPSAEGSTSLKFDSPILQEDDSSAITKAILLTFEVGGVELECYIAAGGFSDSQTATITTRQLKRGGLDITTADTTNDFDLPAGTPVKSVISSFHFEMLLAAQQGRIASGGESWLIGNDADNDIKIFAANGDANKPFYGYDSASSGWVFSNDGVSSTPFGTGAGVTGADGITVTAGAIAVDLATNPGLEFSSNQLRAKVKSAGGVTRDSDGLSIDTSASFDPTWSGDHTFSTGTVDLNGTIQIGGVGMTSTAAELNKLDGAGATVTAANLDTLTDTSSATALHTHPPTTGQTSRASAAGTGTQNIAHGLGVVPSLVKITCTRDGNSNGESGSSYGTATGTGDETSSWVSGATAGASFKAGQSASNIVNVELDSGVASAATLSTLDATNITLTFGTHGNVGSALFIQWTAYP